LFVNCPACGHGLTPVTRDGITVDACAEGCGGLWFDQFELKKVDEAHEASGEALLDIARQPGKTVDREKRYGCPKCPDIVMRRYYSSAKRQVSVDECPNCAGVWLDEGELAAIRKEFASQVERERTNEVFVEDMMKEAMVKAATERNAQAERDQRFARMFRFLYPSYYMPGKQEWGTF
jgi:Zn-finger nucleic acid-binding protein